jgi:hypothetical protein
MGGDLVLWSRNSILISKIPTLGNGIHNSRIRRARILKLRSFRDMKIFDIRSFELDERIEFIGRRDVFIF